ncbi:FCD domain-containing protein [Rhodococcus sp. 14C212]|uniref:FadR/GntR family transcriptional regulator n=1 Tax=Rhodococcus sp. 14C212 TaxID=2711209 RepID=UPI001F0E6C7C|nr:FCD domain-containing protein [Rhodococcus sp. 14C212]
MVAQELRERIFRGEYVGSLPKQEALMEDFQVSAPSIREAFRVLESEGLISVRRGNVGGASIRLPDANDTAYALGLALQAKRVHVKEVAESLWLLEPVSARLCAEREDRATEVVPVLKKIVDESETRIDVDPWEYEAMRFHDALGDLCGNFAVREIIASLFVLYHQHVDEWTELHGSYTTRKERESVVKQHRRLITCIERGDVRGAQRASETHLCSILSPLLDEEIVTAAVPRNNHNQRPREEATSHPG